MLKSKDQHCFKDNVAYANVENSLEEILHKSEIIKDYFSRGEIGVVGAMYNVETGEVDFFKNLTTQPVLKKALTESV
jgi:carbonic anhydrase